MHNYHITHKVFLACTIIGSTPSILGCLLCPSQQLQWDPESVSFGSHQQNKTYLIPLITSYSLLKPLILGVRRG